MPPRYVTRSISLGTTLLQSICPFLPISFCYACNNKPLDVIQRCATDHLRVGYGLGVTEQYLLAVLLRWQSEMRLLNALGALDVPKLLRWVGQG